MFNQLRTALAHPLTRGLDLDDPGTTLVRRKVIAEKRFLRLIYEEWYASIRHWIGEGSGAIVELGSGAGFLPEIIPRVITSDVFFMPDIQLVFDGKQMPFCDGSLRGIAMTNVMHHIPAVAEFFREASRCLRPGGRIVAVEPWVSHWSRWVYTKLHHEPFDPEVKEWSFPPLGPLSSANGALPWIALVRDHAAFESEFPELEIRLTQGIMPFRYHICGGISMRSLAPAFTFPLLRAVEKWLDPRMWASFALIVIERR